MSPRGIFLPRWKICQLKTCRYSERRVEPFADRSEYLSTNFTMKIFPTIPGSSRLLRVFRAEDCQRRDPENHVPALVSRSVLPQARRTGDGSGHFEELQWFIPESPLRILHGRHRLEAARQFLEGSDRWWVVDLYSDGGKNQRRFLIYLLTDQDLNTIVKKELREQDPNASRWYDGDVVRQIRLCTLTGDSPSPDPFSHTARREKCLARLSKSKRTCLLRLEALPGKFLESLDDLTALAGLWPPVRIGTFPRLRNLHCPKVRDSSSMPFRFLTKIEGNDPLFAPSQEDVDLHHWGRRT